MTQVGYKLNNEGSESSNHKPTIAPRVIRKSISLTRRDIADWKRALQIAMAADRPRQYLLQDIFTDTVIDALLTSQMNNRREQSISSAFEMKTPDGKLDKKLTDIIRSIPVTVDTLGYIWDSEWYGSSLVENSVENGIKKVTLINRRNVVPDFGRFYPDTSNDTYIEYRKVREYGKWLLEFNSDHVGLLNKLIPHVLFKKFAQSCWSELCEIFGIPPRYLKTETRDPAMLARAEEMMREVGAAAWFIIDTTEDFQFADGVSTNGDVYNNLITLCNNEISMVVSGAIVGQDTKHGNESKEKTSISLLERLVDADKRMIETYMNAVVIPAWAAIGWIPFTTSQFRFAVSEDTDKLFDMTVKILPYKDVDDAWMVEKFGIKVIGNRGGVNFQ